MLGLAKMCWLAAVYRETDFEWDRAERMAESSLELLSTREEVTASPEIRHISAEYYRIIDGIERAAKIPTLEPIQ